MIWHVDPTTDTAFDFPAEYAASNPFEDVYEDGFVIHELPAAAHHPTDYEVGPDGRVVLVEREYRGKHALVPGRADTLRSAPARRGEARLRMPSAHLPIGDHHPLKRT